MSVNGVPQFPMQRTSLRYSFAAAKGAECHTKQYFEVVCDRAIHHEDWYARSIHKAPWAPKPRRTLQDNSAWQPYNVTTDFRLAEDLAAANPQELAEMQARFLAEAGKAGALPIDDRLFERLDPVAVGRPADAIGSDAKSHSRGGSPK
jgi:arylsulfatase